MTSPVTAQPPTESNQQREPAATSVADVYARRQSAPSTWRRITQFTLVGGTIVASAAAFGPPWVIRVGVVVAVTAAVVATIAAWREIFEARREHARTVLAASVDHGRALSEERTRNGAVVDTLRSRIAEAGGAIDGQRITIAELKVKISGLTGDKAYLRAEVDHREGVITSLRDTVRAREAELVELREGTDAEIHALPQRALVAQERAAWDALPAADELWTDGSHPTVVDLALIDDVLAHRAMPNEEPDRQVS